MDFNEPSLVWYFRSRVKGWMTQLDRETAKPFMEKLGPRFAIIPTNQLGDASCRIAHRPGKHTPRRVSNVAGPLRADLDARS